MKLIFAVLFAILAAVCAQNIFQAGCKTSTIDAAYATFVNNVKKFDNVFDDTAALSYLGSQIALTLELAKCQLLAASFVSQTGFDNTTIVNTHCMVPKTHPRWSIDPCCNGTLRLTQCCVPRSQPVQRPVITGFNSGVNICKNPDLVRALIRHVHRNFDNRDAFCENVMIKLSQDVANMVSGFGQCLSDYLNTAKPCTTNADCLSNVCDTDTYTCQGGFYDSSPTPLSQCIVSSIPKFALRAFALFNGYTDTNVATADLTGILQRVLFKNYCVSSFGVYQPLLTSQSACEGPKVCSDTTPFACPNGNSFCGLLCSTGRQCVSNLGASFAILNSQTNCVNFGQCTGKDNNGNDVVVYVNSTDCATVSQNFCTVKTCYPNCNQVKCEGMGQCLGWPAAPGVGVCILPFNPMDDGSAPTCATGSNIGIGCYANTITDSVACASAKGQFYNYPTSQSQCEQYKLCREPNAIVSLKTSSECQKCNGVVSMPFKWVPGVWRNRIFKQVTSWTPRTLYNANKWVSGIDFLGFAGFVQGAIRVLSYPILKSRIMCSVEPLVAAHKLLACDCGGEQVNGCFDKLKVGAIISFLSKIGNFRALANAVQNYQFADAQITIPSTSVTASSDNANVEISKTDVVVSSSTATARSIRQATAGAAIYVVDGSNNIGQIVGNGISVSVAFPNGMTLCLPTSDQITVSNSKFTKAAFAVKSSSGTTYVYSSAVITSSTDGQICGTVTDTQTYYPAYVDQGASQPKTGAASTVSIFSAIVIAILAMLSML